MHSSHHPLFFLSDPGTTVNAPVWNSIRTRQTHPGSLLTTTDTLVAMLICFLWPSPPHAENMTEALLGRKACYPFHHDIWIQILGQINVCFLPKNQDPKPQVSPGLWLASRFWFIHLPECKYHSKLKSVRGFLRLGNLQSYSAYKRGRESIQSWQHGEKHGPWLAAPCWQIHPLIWWKS